MDYVNEYRKLDAEADELEGRADADRWHQCRIAHEAVEAGESRRSFAKAVDKSDQTISRQVAMWDRWGAMRASQRPRYSDAYNELVGRPGGPESTAERGRQIVRNLPPAEQEKVAAELPPAVLARQAARPDVARAIARNDEAREQVEDHATEHRARYRPDTDLDPGREGRQAASGIGRAAGVDPATRSLRQAAGLIAEAVLERDELGIEHEDTFADALDRVKRAVAALEARTISEDDRAWLESIGAQA